MSAEQNKDSAETTQSKQQNSDEHAEKVSTSSKSLSSSKASNKKKQNTTTTTNNEESTNVEIPAQPNETNQRDTDQREETLGGDQPESVDGQHETSSMQYIICRRPISFDPVAVVFALLVFVGGLIGYITKDSTSSLVAGTVFALLLAVGIYFDGARKNSYPLMVILLALAGLMFWRYSEKWAFMPSGLITLLAALMFSRHAYLLYLRGQVVTT